MTETEDYDKTATPTAHASTHENGGTDEISVDGLLGLLGESQTPIAHKTSHQDEGSDEISVAGLSGLLADDQHVVDSEVLAVVQQYIPWTIDIDVFPTPKSNVNWDFNNMDANSIYYGYKSGTGAQNNSIAWDVILTAGTWSVELMYHIANAFGVFSIQFDSVEKGMIDSYSPVYSQNARASITGISVPTSAKVELKLKMATKNDASGGYQGVIQHVRLTRTA